MSRRACISAAFCVATCATASCTSARDGESPYATFQRLGGPRLVEAAASERTVRVELPSTANDSVRIEDATSQVSVRFALRRASAVSPITSDGITLYARGLDDADLLYRVHAHGVEDYVLFASRPAHEELVYDVDVTHVAGVTLVANVVEFLDEDGAPRLRIAPPYVLDAAGSRSEARIEVDGCAYDTSPAPPWRRAVTPPASSACRLRVWWTAVVYPALVDPDWTATGALATARSNHVAAMLQSGRVLIAGGSETLANAEVYDPATGTFAVTGPLGVPRYAAMSATLPSGKVLVIGGAMNLDAASAELYDPITGEFSATGSMSTVRRGASAITLASGKVLVAGGYNMSLTGVANAELYDPAAGVFAPTGTMGAGRFDYTATLLLSGQVLIAGGLTTPSNLLASAELYDASLGTFAATGTMATPRALHTATQLASGKVLMLAGQGPSSSWLTSAELFDPSIGMFTSTASLAESRARHRATVLPSGNVLITGGQYSVGNSTIYRSSTEIYDADAGTLATTTALNTARSGHSASLLASGRVLVVGGNNDSTLTSAELFADLSNGAACTKSTECNSTHCVDAVCCGDACSGQCEACDVAGSVGSCVPVDGVPHGNRLDCTGRGNACGGTCSTSNGMRCVYTPATTACAATCLVSTRSDGTCDGQGRCVASAAQQCPDHFACDGTSACKSRCDVEEDCATGFSCRGDGRCVAGGVCLDSETSQPVDGPAVSCAPYKCDITGSCRKVCVSVDDCATGNACDPSGTCGQATSSSGDATGCATAPLSRASSASAASWVLFALAAALQRRSRGQRPQKRHGPANSACQR